MTIELARSSKVSGQIRTVQTIVSSLKGHLDESVGAETVTRNEILAVDFELQSLAVILADQVTQPCFCKAYACSEFWIQSPFELLGCGVDYVWRRCRRARRLSML